jgi:hypothetical protein
VWNLENKSTTSKVQLLNLRSCTFIFQVPNNQGPNRVQEGTLLADTIKGIHHSRKTYLFIYTKIISVEDGQRFSIGSIMRNMPTHVLDGLRDFDRQMAKHRVEEENVKF